MIIRLKIIGLPLLLGGLWSICAFTAAAQEAKPATPPAAPKTGANEGFGNVQVLKGVHDLLPTMHFIRASLGVRCDYCHITQTGKYYLDDKPAKRRAREMIIMTRQLNELAYGGRQVVTCNTCHRGSLTPVRVPQIASDFVNTTRVEPFEPPPPTLPSVEVVLAKYEAATRISAIGPAHLRIEVVRAKVIHSGTPSARVLPRSDRSVAEALVDGERGTLTTAQPNGRTSLAGSNGKRVWFMAESGVQWITAGDIAQLRRKINPLLVLQFRPADYSSVTVAGIDKIDGSDTYRIEVVGTDDDSSETLWFSRSDGLMLRRTYYHETLLGPEPEQYDLSEYKRFGALQLPTAINASYLDDQHLGVLKRLIEVKLGATVTDSDFEPPSHQDNKTFLDRDLSPRSR